MWYFIMGFICIMLGSACIIMLATSIAARQSLKCSYYKVGKEQTDDDNLWKVNITEPCNKPAVRVYNGIAICEQHFKEKMKDDKEAMRQQIRDTKDITDFKLGKLRIDIEKMYAEKKNISWKEATWKVLAQYAERYGFFWGEPLSKVLIDEAMKRDTRKA